MLTVQDLWHWKSEQESRLQEVYLDTAFICSFSVPAFDLIGNIKYKDSHL